jgi:RimJ/RimL family protein N-acetyltransferase
MIPVNIIVQTNEIYLRDININDVDNGWLDWVNNKSLFKYLSSPSGYSRDQLIEYMENSKLPTSKILAVCRVKDDLYMGNVRLSSIDNTNLSAAYGRLIGVTGHGCKNVGTNTLIMIAYYAFVILKLNRIYSGVVASNIASVKSNMKAGFHNEGTSRESTFINGKFIDSIRFSMLRSDFFDKNLISNLVFNNNENN